MTNVARCDLLARTWTQQEDLRADVQSLWGSLLSYRLPKFGLPWYGDTQIEIADQASTWELPWPEDAGRGDHRIVGPGQHKVWRFVKHHEGVVQPHDVGVRPRRLVALCQDRMQDPGPALHHPHVLCSPGLRKLLHLHGQKGSITWQGFKCLRKGASP